MTQRALFYAKRRKAEGESLFLTVEEHDGESSAITVGGDTSQKLSYTPKKEDKLSQLSRFLFRREHFDLKTELKMNPPRWFSGTFFIAHPLT